MPLNKRIRAAREELVKLGVLVDSGRRLNGQVVWILNPKLTEAEQKALIESSTGADANPKQDLRRSTIFAPIERVSARDLFSKLESLGIREMVAPDGLFIEWSRCLTDGHGRLPVLLTDDGYVDYFSASEEDEPEEILVAIRQTFGTELISDDEPGFEDWIRMRGTTLYAQN